MKSRSRIRFMSIGWRVSTSQNNHNVALGLELFLYLFSSKIGIFHKFLYRTFWYSRNYTYFYFPKWRYKPRMVLKITNLHILRYLPTCWLYLLECYTIDNQWCTHTASKYTEMTKADKIQACYQHPVCSMRMAWSWPTHHWDRAWIWTRITRQELQE